MTTVTLSRQHGLFALSLGAIFVLAGCTPLKAHPLFQKPKNLLMLKV